MSTDEANAPDAAHARTGKAHTTTRIAAITARVLRWRLVRAWLLYSEKHGPALADGVTYRALFSVFAAVLLGFSAAALLLAGNPDALSALVSAVNAAIPGLVGPGGLVDPSAIQAPAGLSIAGVIGVVGLVGAALGAIGSLRIALRTLADEVADDVLWYWVLLRNLALALGIAIAFVLTAAATVFSGVGATWFATLLGGEHSAASVWIERILAALLVYALDLVVVAGLFAVLSGVRAPRRLLWQGAALGAVGLLVLQQLSSLFVGGAKSNPLLASFAALIAMLLWLNLSAQVLLLSGAWIITAVEDERDSPLGTPQSLAELRLDRAELLLQAAEAERDAARAQLEKEDPEGLARRDELLAPPAAPERPVPWYRRLFGRR